MELIWLVLGLLALDLAALLFAADSRPGFEHSSRSHLLRPARRGTPRPGAPRGTRRSVGR
jgi:hypothetical protein